MTAGEQASQAATDAPTVYLHVGVPKSGTTYLQSRFATNAERAREQGLLWPGPKWRAHAQGAKDLRALEGRDRLDPQGPWMRLAEEARRWTGRAVLVSMEWLAECTPAQVSAAVASLQPCRVEVVVTVRDLLRSFVAQWQQMTQQQRPWSWQQYVHEMTDGSGGPTAERFWAQHDVPALLRRWAAEVPPERIHLVTVPPPGADADLLWTRFCSVVEVDGTGFTDPPRVNESLGVVSAELMHRVNLTALEAGMPLEDYERVMRLQYALGVLVPRRTTEDAIAVSDDVDSWVRRRAARLVEEIRGWDIDVVGDLEDLLPGEALDGREPSDVTDGELLETCVDSLVELAMDQHLETIRVRSENAQLRRRIARARARSGGSGSD